MKGVIFDMDGLMFDTERLWKKEWKAMADSLGIKLEPVFHKEITGTSGDLMLQVIAKYYHTDKPQYIADMVRTAVEEDLQVELPEKPGLHEILEACRERGYLIAAASSSPKELIISNLERAHVLPYFNAICCGVDVENGKPAPDIFLLAANKLELEPSSCYVLEDSYNGIRAAYTAGCKAIMVPDMQEPTIEMEEKAAHICRSLYDAIPYLS